MQPDERSRVTSDEATGSPPSLAATQPGAMAASAEAPGAGSQRGAAVRRLAVGMLGALAGQFVLGMLANLYLTVPRHHPWTAAHPAWLLYAHAAYGAGLVFAALSVVFRCLDSGVPRAGRWAATTLAGTAAALVAGVAYVGGGQAAWLSLVMALGFAVAVTGSVGMVLCGT